MLVILDMISAGYVQIGHAVACSIQTALFLVETLWKCRLSAEPLKSTVLMDCIACAHETVHIYGEDLRHEQEWSGHTLRSTVHACNQNKFMKTIFFSSCGLFYDAVSNSACVM